MPLTATEKERRRYDRLLAKAKEFRPHIYLQRYVAKDFQRMIRAEAGAAHGDVLAVVDGEIAEVFTDIGECVCVTCGKVYPWQTQNQHGNEGLDTGHFLPKRRQATLLEETMVAPQCQRCNKYCDGMPTAFRLWMEYQHGEAEIRRLEALHETQRKFTHDELVRWRIQYMDRTAAAIAVIDGSDLASDIMGAAE